VNEHKSFAGKFLQQTTPITPGGIMSTTDTTAAVPALKLFADAQPGSPVSVGTVNFRVSPPQATGLSILRNDGTFVNDHEILGNNQAVSVGFDLAEPLPRSLSVRLVGLVSRLGSQDGYSPISLSVNGQTIVSHYTVPGGGYNPTEVSFPVPVELLQAGRNSYTVQVGSDAQSYFWLYEMGVTVSPYTRVMSADMTKDPPVTTGMAITANQGGFQNDHWRYGNNQQLAVSFDLQYVGAPRDQVLLSVTGLVSRNGGQDGFSPITITVNGQTLAANVTVSGGGYNPEQAVFVVPTSMLRPGSNSAAIQVAANAQTYFWLYRLDVTELAFFNLVGTADVSVYPATATGVQITQNDGWFQDDHLRIGNNGRFTVSFPLSAPTPLLIDFVGLVSRNGSQDGYSPVTLSINGQTIASNYTVPGGGYDYQPSWFYVARESTQAGQNSVIIQVAADAQTYFWLRSQTVFSI
jgi:hypothetical protein